MTHVVRNVMALRMEFGARPESSGSVSGAVCEMFRLASLEREGFLNGMLLISDREARLVTVLTLWETRAFERTRERRISWMRKLLADYAEGGVRALTHRAQFLGEDTSNEVFALSCEGQRRGALTSDALEQQKSRGEPSVFRRQLSAQQE